MTAPLQLRRPALSAMILGALYGAALVLAFPPVFLPYFVLLIPLPCLVVARLAGRDARLAFAFALGAAPGHAVLHLWMSGITLAGYPFLVLVLSAYSGMSVWLARRSARVLAWWVAVPLAWTAAEFLKGAVLFDGYPWHLTAQPLAATGLGRAMALVGVYGLGFLVALTLAGVIAARGRARLIILVAGALIVVGGGVFRGTERASARVARVAVVQTDVAQDNKIGWTFDQRAADFARFLALTREAAAHDPDLIVWPETMFPGIALDAESVEVLDDAGLMYPGGVPVTVFSRALLDLQLELGVPMLVGAIAYDGFAVVADEAGVRLAPEAEYNSAILLTGGLANPYRYDKLHLTPFGEVMPGISWSDWLESRLLAIGAPGMSFTLSAGREATVFEVGGLRFATPICFEATMPGVCRRLAYDGGARRVDALVQLTNDGWFGRWRGGRETHLLLARCRALELGVPVVRAANTGISAIISADGRVRDALGAGSEGVLVVEVPLDEAGATLYGRVLGDAVAWFALGGTFAGVAVSFRKKRTSKETRR